MATNNLEAFITRVETKNGVDVPNGGHTQEKDLVFFGRISSSDPVTVEIRDLRNLEVLGTGRATPGTPFRVEVNGLAPRQYVVAVAEIGNGEEVDPQWKFTVI